jgi:hypothetical protein
MLIYHSLKVIFVHLHKCGGTSIEFAFEPFQKYNDIILGSTTLGDAIDGPYHSRFGLWKHSSAQEILEVVGPQIWTDYYKFAVVRNPFERIASIYRYCLMLRQRSLRQGEPRLGLSGDELRTLALENRYPEISPWNWPVAQACFEVQNSDHPFRAFLQSPKFISDVAAEPQWSRLASREGDSLLNDIVKLECIAEAWAHLSERVCLPFHPCQQ